MKKNNTNDHLKSLLKERSIKATKPRLLVLEVFYGSKKPLRVKDVEKIAQKSKVDPATIYRTVATFENAGLVKKVDLRKDAAFYEYASGHKHHIVCTRCEKVEDFKDCDFEENLKKIVARSSSFDRIDEHSFELFGVCRKCERKKL